MNKEELSFPRLTSWVSDGQTRCPIGTNREVFHVPGVRSQRILQAMLLAARIEVGARPFRTWALHIWPFGEYGCACSPGGRFFRSSMIRTPLPRGRNLSCADAFALAILHLNSNQSAVRFRKIEARQRALSSPTKQTIVASSFSPPCKSIFVNSVSFGSGPLSSLNVIEPPPIFSWPRYAPDARARASKPRSGLHASARAMWPANASLISSHSFSFLSSGRRAACLRVFFDPFSGGGKSTPARRAFERPMAIACLAERAPCLPSRTCSISSRTNSPA